MKDYFSIIREGLSIAESPKELEELQLELIEIQYQAASITEMSEEEINSLNNAFDCLNNQIEKKIDSYK